jgi:hypothetical protein
MTAKSVLQSALALGLLLGGAAITRVAMACNTSCPPGQTFQGAGTSINVPLDGNWHSLPQNRGMIEGGSGPYGTIMFVDLTNGSCAFVEGVYHNSELPGCGAEDDTADGSSAEANQSACDTAQYMFGSVEWCQ